jgi:alpha-galactosidase
MKSIPFYSALGFFGVYGFILSTVLPLQAQNQTAANTTNAAPATPPAPSTPPPAAAATAAAPSSYPSIPNPFPLAEIRTPKAPATPRINGPDIFGVRPANPFLYHIPATGSRPMEYSVDNLPTGLTVDAATGQITGLIAKPGEYDVTLHAKNALGADEKKFKIKVGETISLTPPLGWNSWNCWRDQVTAADVLESAQGMAASGLIDHGWTYVNIDDTWQGPRDVPFNALQGDEKFPDMKGLCDKIHALGLKAGIYSTPWVTSYAGFPGGSAQNPEGTWTAPTIPKKGNVNKKILPWAVGQYSFADNDAAQWAAWGFDYLKYDWSPNELPETKEMYDALRKSGRDVVYSLSNNTPFKNIGDLSKLANCWRITGDISENWNSIKSHGFGKEGGNGADVQRWIPYAGPGHWNDPDMMEVGYIRIGKTPHITRLTPDEQYTHVTLWCLLAAPLLLGCDLQHLDSFTLNLLTNDEVLAVDQDALGKEAQRVGPAGNAEVYVKDLEDGSKAVGLFNVGETTATVTVKWADLKINGKKNVRDLWRQKDLGSFDSQFGLTVAPHGAELVKIGP